MGNIACVPQAPGGFRSSFRRKPSLKKEQNGKKKLPSFFGLDGGQERDTSTDKILQYIPAKILQKQENQKENLDQRLPSLFKRGRRRMVVRDLGKMIYYSKVKLKFQHCQEVQSCFLELFQSHLYLQSSGPNGLTYQELLPLRELQVQELGAEQSPGQQDHALHISGPLLKPLVVLCQSKAELKQWLYHLEKQIQLCGGSLALPLLPQGPGDKEELRWSVQNLPVQDWRGTQRESLGEILCLSKVKLQHLPFQEQHERLLVLYPSTLVIVSEEPGGLCFKGELPLNAIQVLFEENDKSSFLIEGRLINSIRVTCASYQDYQEWLYCLNTAQFRNADSSLSGSESFSVGSRLPQPSQFPSSVRGSLSSDGQTSSGGRVTALTALTALSQSSGSLPEAPSFPLGPEGRLLQEPLTPGYSQPLHPSRGSCSPVPSLQSLAVPSWPSPALPRQGLRRGSSARSRRGRGSGHGVPSQEQEHGRSLCRPVPKQAGAELLSPVYQEPYCAQGTQQHPLAPLDAGTRQGQPGAARGAVPGAQQLSLEQWHCQPLPGPCTVPTYSTPGTSRRLQLRAPAQGSHLGEMCSLPQQQPGPELHPPDGPYDLADAACSCRDSSSFHDYAELQSFQSDRSYDNLWEAEEAQPGGPRVFQV